MEIMTSSSHHPIAQKFIEKVRPNTYRITPLGLSRAAALLSDLLDFLTAMEYRFPAQFGVAAKRRAR